MWKEDFKACDIGPDADPPPFPPRLSHPAPEMISKSLS
jgi:hypothetical protein